jgi:hypothetical protein
VLTPADDYPLHQTSQPIAVPAGGDLDHYDRYFFNGYTADGSLYFAAALGVYPNRSVIDGAFSVVRDGWQVSVLASGRCPLDRRRTTVGPITVEVLEPMRSLRVVVDAVSSGLEADVVFRARTAAVAEPHFRRFDGVRAVFDYTRFTQWGAWDGWVAVDGTRVSCDPAAVLGARDRSWGTRPVGERAPGAPGPAPQFFWLWAPVNFPDVCTHFDVNEEGDGRRWHEFGAVVPTRSDVPEVARTVDYRLSWRPGTRRVASFEVDLVPWTGPTATVRLEPIVDFQMLGLGYLHPEWSHGTWHGESAVTGERWPLPVADPFAPHHLHVQTLCRATWGDRHGTGILEQLVIGPHAPTGLTGLFDGAP